MVRILLFFVIVVVVSASKIHPKIRRSEDDEALKRASCASDVERSELVQKSLCGEPKEVFVELKLTSSYLQVVPSFVWVKRCVGLCTFEGPNTHCAATKTRTEAIPVRLYNAKTNKESCNTYDVVVHETCGCFNQTFEGCPPPRVYNSRKSSCQCPNSEERRNCLRKRSKNNHSVRWNRSKCTCEIRRSTR